MRGSSSGMIEKVLVLAALCRLSHTSGVGRHLDHLEHIAPLGVPAAQIAPVVPPPQVVTSASSQYFERTFNRLIVAPPVLEAVPFVAPAPVPVATVPSVIPVARSPSVIHLQPVTKTVPVTSTHNVPQDPNVAIAVATAHAAAPVSTILLPPYLLGPPQSIGFIPSSPPVNVPDDKKEETTTRSTVERQTTPIEPETTTRTSNPFPLPSNTANSFAQVLPSNQNMNVNQQYGPPQPPLPKPQKSRTSVEVVPVPLQYIAPPPLAHLHHHHQGHHPHHGHYSHAHIHTYIPTPAKVIVRPVKVRRVRVPVRVIRYKSLPARNNARSDVAAGRDTEPTTFSPLVSINRPVSKPPKL